MLTDLIRFSLHNRVVVLLLACFLIVAGAVAVRDAPWDIFPEFAPPQLVVQTEAPGLSTTEVEQLVTVPIESALNGLSRLRVLRSSSTAGLSVVTVIFEDGTNILDARQLANERLVEVDPRLPAQAETPRMTPLKASTSRLLMVGLTSDNVSLQDLRTTADWSLRRRLEAVSGVAQCEIFGGERKQYQILVRPEQLQHHQLTLNQVLAAARQSTGFGGAGFIETPNQRLAIRQRTRIETTADIAAVPVVIEAGVPLSLGDVATVQIGAADQVGDATINGQPGVLLIIHKQPDFNTLAVTQNVQRVLDDLKGTLPEGVELQDNLFRQASFIERAISNLNHAILIGCVLVTLILIAFLFQWRTVVISLTAVPLSLLGAILILRWFGASLNAMTLGGLAIALGELVDDAIVDVENVLRRLRENRLSAQPLPAFQVVLDASIEVRSAVVYASFIVIIVFLPVFYMGGLGGTFFVPLGIAYATSILVSLVVALTVTPAMCLWLLKDSGSEAQREPLLVRLLVKAYRWTLIPALRFRWLTLFAALGGLVAALAAVPFLGGEFLPDFRESNFVIFMSGKPDSSLVESRRMGGRVASELMQVPGVQSVAQQIGRADLSEDTWGPEISEVWVNIDGNADYELLLDEIRESVESQPGYVFQTKQFLRERIDEVLTGSTAQIVIRVVGPELSVLRSNANTIAEIVRGIDGVTDLRVEQMVDVPQVEILLRPQQAAQYGFSVGELNAAIQTLLKGTVVGQVYEQDQVFDVVVRSASDLRRHPADLGALLLDAPTGDRIPLNAVAEIGVVDAPNVINRERASRRILVTCNASGRDVASVVQDIQSTINQKIPKLPIGYHLEYGGEHEARAAAQDKLLLLGAAALAGIFMLLYLDFRSVGLSLMVMLSVPLACCGGVAAVLVTGGNLSLGSLVGFVTVFGVAVRNGILLISNYQHLQRAGKSGRELILHGSTERLAPILMTASSTGLALLPLIIGGDLPGHEIEYPMAVVIIGGLLSSTFLTLYVLPALYDLLGNRFARSQTDS
jgi:CzcA family heavy metal efflux pump